MSRLNSSDIDSIPTDLVELLRCRALDRPRDLAYTFLSREDESRITYEELHNKARAIASHLCRLDVNLERALLLYPSGLDFIEAFFGCLYAGVVAVPLPPPHANRPNPRLNAVLENAEADVVLSTASLLEAVKAHCSTSTREPRFIATDVIHKHSAEQWQPADVAGDTIAMLQYTSGSTNTPKGVMLSHSNLIHNLSVISNAFTDERMKTIVGLFWLPNYHDMGLIGGILAPLYIGNSTILMSPADFVLRPYRWLEAITRFRVTISGAPSFAYDMCVNKITSEQRARLDLSSWELAFCGAEPIHDRTVKRFTDTFASCGFQPEAFYPCYGLAEATLLVSGSELRAPPTFLTVEKDALEEGRAVQPSREDTATKTLVSSGKILPGQNVAIVHPDSGMPCTPVEVGEVWVSGPSVAEGYWNRLEETEASFRAYIAETEQGPFLRTGDLGFIHDQELFVTGRLRDLIIIRGRNYYPQDIELQVERCHPALAKGSTAAFSIEDAVTGEERLVVVKEIDRHEARTADFDEVMEAVRRTVAEVFDIQVYGVALVRGRSIPKTSSGKVQRFVCRREFLEETLNVLAQWRTTSSPSPLPSAEAATGDPKASLGKSIGEIETWLISHISVELNLPPSEIDVEQPFAHFGMDSLKAISLAADLASWLGRTLPPTLAYDYPNIKVLSRYLAGESNSSPSSLARRKTGDGATEPIAIVGLGCRFPGASGPVAFWDLLAQGVDAITPVPAGHWDERSGEGRESDLFYGGFLRYVDQFDADFFGISPREAIHMDPQQRLLLEVCWETLEDAGLTPQKLEGARTGVFIGVSHNEYGELHFNDPSFSDPFAGTGNALSIVANRLSYWFGLRGPSMAVDTACSSSLVAVHLACRSLWSGECESALVGGSNLILSPTITINFREAGFMAPDGRCKTFDARADGYVRGEGVGIVMLKPLSKAVADSDSIYAVIRGSAINQDGRTNGLTAPNGQAQKDVLLQAYLQAGVAPARVQYVEAHGTGTKLGDPIEAQALGEVVGLARGDDEFCAVGSVKTNIGHLEAAAGIAGLIKTALALKHRTIPPSLHFEQPNSYIPFDKLRLRVQQKPSPWPESPFPALAGVSSFGFGGTNAHVVLEEAPREEEGEEAVREGVVSVLPLSARSPEALEALAKSYVGYLKSPSTAQVLLEELCYNASVRRSHHRHRVALLAHNRQELVARLEEWVEGRSGVGSGEAAAQPDKVVFVFSGQGSQWLQMGLALRDEPVYQEKLQECDELLRRYTDWSLLDELSVSEEGQSRLAQTQIAQPAICALQLALASLWRSWGIEPDAVIGHSVGEVAAAQVAGVLSLEEAMRVVYHRGRLMQQASGQGKMAAVGLSWEEAQDAVASYGDRLSVAACNSPHSAVLSGEARALAEVVQLLEPRGVFTRMLDVDYAFHSPQMEAYRSELVEALGGLEPRAAMLPIISTVTGRSCTQSDFGAEYWGRNIREPVRFARAIEYCVKAGYESFLEIGPHPVLGSAIRQSLEGLGVQGSVLASLHRQGEARATLLTALGVIYEEGHAVKWEGVYPRRRRHVPLPVYPWQRKRYWKDNLHVIPSRRGLVCNNEGATSGHSHLEYCASAATEPGVHLWTSKVDTDQFHFLEDHQVQGAVVLPAASYAEMALAAGTAFRDLRLLTLENMEFKKALVLRDGGGQMVQLVVSPGNSESLSVQFFSRTTGNFAPQEPWSLHATGTIRLGNDDTDVVVADHTQLAEIRDRCRESFSSRDYYEAMEERGLEYGPSFQWIKEIWRRDGEALARLHIPEDMAENVNRYSVHPALLDSCFQVMGVTFLAPGDDGIGDEAYLPVSWRSLRVLETPSSERELWAHVVLDPDSMLDGGDKPRADIFLLDRDGRAIVEVRDLGLQRVAADLEHPREEDVIDWFYEIQWMPKDRVEVEETEVRRPADSAEWWLIFADRKGAGGGLVKLMTEAGQRCVVVEPADSFALDRPGFYRVNPLRQYDLRRLLDETVGPNPSACRGVVHLWSLDATDPAEQTTLSSIDRAQRTGSHNVMHLVQAMVQAGWRDLPRLYLVTSQAQRVGSDEGPVSLAISPLWGLSRAIAHEHSELHCTMVDIGCPDASKEIISLFQELSADELEDQIALRGDERFVARFVRSREASEETGRHGTGGEEHTVVVSSQDQVFRLETSKPGVLNNLIFRQYTRRSPDPGEVEIRVFTSGLNFRDVMKAMGLYPGADDDFLWFGDECSGEIVAVGEGVDAFEVGDHVIGVAPGAFSAYVTTSAQFVVKKPAGINFHEAATIPIAYLTAYYSLHHLGRLTKGERVLIHSAAGGVGLAAIQLAQHIGAEVFATAGSPEKRDYLRSLGVQHVADSRSLAFADEFMQVTKGEGVDVVLNSLAGEAIPKSLSVLRAYGRFLEIGKRDIYQDSKIGLSPFQNNLSFFAIDMDRLFRERAKFSGDLLREVFALLESGAIMPLPLTRFPISEVTDAFKNMAEAKHTGKIVLSFEPQELRIAPALESPVLLRDDRSYLITGGLGDLGLKVADWMVQRGARHVVLMGRRGPSGVARDKIERLRKAGAEVLVVQADVSQEQQVRQCFETIELSIAPLAGIIHAAAVFDDAFLIRYDRDRFEAVTMPKIAGGWILHKLSADKPLDFFILFSSVASIFGSAGQGGYCAANAFLDALAHYRQAQGLPALSINWGPWAEVGRAAKGSSKDTFRGIASMPPEKALEAFGQLLGQRQGQISVVPVDVQRWRQVYPRAAESPLLENLAEEQKGAMRSVDSAVRRTLLALESGAVRRSFLESHLLDEITSLLRISRAAVDRHTPLSTLGFESLMAFELRNRLEDNLGVSLSATLIWGGHSNIAELADYLANKMGVSLDSESLSQSEQETPAESEELSELLDELERLDDDEVRRLFTGSE